MKLSRGSRAGTTEPATRLTLILSGDTIRQTMHFAAWVDAIEAAFKCRARGGVTLPSAVHIPASGGGFHIKAAAMSIGPGYVAVKINGNFPDNRRVAQLPTIQGAIILCDRRNGFPLAILDSTEITAQRTAAATAVAARFLARPGVGADNDDKQELDPQLLKAGRVVVDSLDQCAAIGELHHALQAGVMNRSQVQAELSDVISGCRVGRVAADDIVIFDSTGSAIQDVAAASAVFERARQNGSGISVKLA